jgi:drug/metabolite transporter (DMT)-like permease
VVTLLWGSQHAVIKSALASSPDYPGVFNLLRFGLASLCFWPWTPSVLPPSLGTCSENGDEGLNAAEKERQGLWRAGAELGIWMFLGFALQAVGLQFTSASRSGFLLYLNVKLVPLFAWLLLGRRPSLDVVVFALLAFVGTALLSVDGGRMPNVGDAWSLAAAAASAMFILRLEGAAKAYSLTRAKELNSATLWVTTGLCAVWAGVEAFMGYGGEGGDGGGLGVVFTDLLREEWPQIVFLGVVASALCNWIQTLGQREVPAEKAALIYALDPVYGAVFARLLLGESEALGTMGYTGAALVTSAAVLATFYGKRGGEGSAHDESGMSGIELSARKHEDVEDQKEKGEVPQARQK